MMGTWSHTWKLRLSAAVAVTSMLAGGPVYAQVPDSPFSYSRVSEFTYFGSTDGSKNGLLRTEKIEPGSADSCLQTTHDYDTWGNRNSTTVANCATPVPTVDAKFTARSGSQSFSIGTMPVVTVGGQTFTLQAGQFPLESTNALAHLTVQRFDPRWGLPIEATDANGNKVTIEYDQLGRKLKEKRFNDDQSVSQGRIWRYCILPGKGLNTSTNSAGCPSTTVAPDDAIEFVQTFPIGNSEGIIGQAVVTFVDRGGRTIRIATDGFDGPDQPVAVKDKEIVADTVYNSQGLVVLQSQPYWAATGSTTTYTTNDAGATKTVFDALGRPVSVYVVDSKGNQPNITFGAGPFAGYGAYGVRLAALTDFDYQGMKTTITDDRLHKRTEERNPIGEVVRVTDHLGAQIVKQYEAFGALRYTLDPLGNKVFVSTTIRGFKNALTDPDAGYTSYAYNALGELVWQQNPKQDSNRTEFRYDKLGRMTQRIGNEYTSTWYFDKDAAGQSCRTASATSVGQLCESRTSNEVRKRHWYNRFGWPINERTDIGPIAAPTRSWAQSRTWNDNQARVLTSTWPSGVQVGYSYTLLGQMIQVNLKPSVTIDPLPSTAGGTPGPDVAWAADKVLWRAQARNAWGQLERQSTGLDTDSSNVTTRTSFEVATGRITSRRAGLNEGSGSFSQEYTWDNMNRLAQRIDRNGDGTRDANDQLKEVSESFEYDSLNRMNRYVVSHPDIPSGSRAVTMVYNALGMPLKRSDIGAYTYPSVVVGQTTPRPHAVRTFTPTSGTPIAFTYDANGNLYSADGGKYRVIDYTTFNQPSSDVGVKGPGSSPQYTWQYDETQARIKEVQAISSGTMAGTRTTWRMHPDNAGGLSFEFEDNAPTVPSAANPDVDQSRHYLSVEGRVVAVLVTQGAMPTLSATAKGPTVLNSVILRKVEHWYTDHLGSVISTTDHNGLITSRNSYDPFGQRRPATGAADPGQTIELDWDPALNRRTGNGFTGHEHLDDVGIIHMNGRIFDPKLGVFMQPDPLIQQPNNLQNYNRYTYCINGPMGCTDPSGLSFISDLFDALTDKWYAPPGVKGYIVLRATANTELGYQIGVIAIAAGSYFCTGYAFACNAAGQAAWAGFSGASASDAVKVGVQAGLSTYVNQLIGTYATDPGWNTAAHAAWGCAEGELSGGDCGSGARGAFASSLISSPDTTYGNPYENVGDLVVNTAIQAGVGGLAAVAGGGKFAQGARSAAFAYLFNELMHSGWGGNAEDRLRRAGYESTKYDDGTICPMGKACYRTATYAPTPTEEEFVGLLDGIGGLADAITQGCVLACPPVAAVSGTVGLTADFTKFLVTGDRMQLILDVGLPRMIQRGFPTGAPAQEFVKEAAGQAAKSVGTAAYEQRKREGGP
jgi:RHS repeat-associated protein